MKQWRCRVRKKLLSDRAETISELLVSVLVISLGLAMFATALMSARRMLSQGDAVIKSYYEGRNRLEEEAFPISGSLMLQDSTGPVNLCAPVGESTVHPSTGVYDVQIYSDAPDGDTSGDTASDKRNYRYKRNE